ncbi:hypothetical protein F8M41_020788 [Gigaspora margarita]|uniref:Uncharacterized protein n=1 Tax=Gigaspora margarita TaxID=4874 RepID=A0A8H4AI07_GIGMA|nr:hypothetical protein F8M41_020788 [Gigaspora margarita]
MSAKMLLQPYHKKAYKHKKDATNSNNSETVHEDKKEEGQEEVPMKKIECESPLIDKVKDNYKEAES